MTQTLTVLRERIAALDRHIMELAAERLDLAARIGEEKRRRGIPIRSYGTESAVLERYRAAATQLGLDAGFAQGLASSLIGEAVRRQERDLVFAETSRDESDRLRILIVGGAGKMGRWLVGFFAEQGHGVSVLDPGGRVEGAPSVSGLEAIDEHDVVLLAMPLSRGPEVLRSVLTRNPPALVADISSLKSHLLDDLRTGARRGLRVASLHPLFGPGVRTLAGRTVVVCDCGNPEATAQAARLFEGTALTITRMPVERHDEHMQYVLGLSHLISILFATTLTHSGLSFSDLTLAGSTTFYKQVRTAAEVVAENAEMYGEIQRLNRHSGELYALVRESLASLENGVLGEDPTAFARLIEEARAYFPAEIPREIG